MHGARTGLLTALTIFIAAGSASAQQIPWNDRIFANISFGAQGGSETLSRSTDFTLYEETGTIEATRDVKGGSIFDVVVGGRIRGSFGAAIGFTRREKSSDGSLTAQVPDPAFFEQPRSVSLTLADLAHRETWVTPMAVWFYPLAEKIDLMAMAGPAFVSVENEQFESATIAETGSGPQVTPATATAKESAVGFSLGVDVRYLVIENVGVGGFLRIVKASVDLPGNQSLSVGGLQAGVGIRIRY
jgi:hypothetical protein